MREVFLVNEELLVKIYNNELVHNTLLDLVWFVYFLFYSMCEKITFLNRLLSAKKKCLFFVSFRKTSTLRNIVLGIVIAERDQLVQRISESFAIVFTLNVATMVVGFLTALVFRLNFKQALTISLESGNQNGTLAIQIGSLINKKLGLGFPAAVYSLFMYFTAAVPIWIGIKKSKNN